MHSCLAACKLLLPGHLPFYWCYCSLSKLAGSHSLLTFFFHPASLLAFRISARPIAQPIPTVAMSSRSFSLTPCPGIKIKLIVCRDRFINSSSLAQPPSTFLCGHWVPGEADLGGGLKFQASHCHPYCHVLHRHIFLNVKAKVPVSPHNFPFNVHHICSWTVHVLINRPIYVNDTTTFRGILINRSWNLASTIQGFCCLHFLLSDADWKAIAAFWWHWTNHNSWRVPGENWNLAHSNKIILRNKIYLQIWRNKVILTNFKNFILKNKWTKLLREI